MKENEKEQPVSTVSVENIYRLNGRVPLSRAIPFGLQHVLAMFVANLAPVLIVCSAALVRGTDFAAGSHGGAIRQQLQQRMERQGAAPLLAELQTIDPAAAARLHLRDEKRIVRALEVYYETGETITEHDRKSRETLPRYRALRIGLAFRDRADMWVSIDRRVDDMVAQGLLQEVETLLQSGLPHDATALQAIGYKQFLAVAEGRATVDEAIAEVKLRSRQYAKRQLTWLRRDEDIHWILWEKTPDFPAGLQNATEFLLSAGVC